MAWEDESGQVWLSWNDLVWLAERHGRLAGDVLGMNAVLEKLAAAAAG